MAQSGVPTKPSPRSLHCCLPATYASDLQKHKGAAGTAKVTKANSRQTGDEVEVVFYGFSPMTSGDTKLMIYSNEFGDTEAPRVRMSPVSCPLVLPLAMLTAWLVRRCMD